MNTDMEPGDDRREPVLLHMLQSQISTKMHSSRMRTARLLTVSQHALGRGVYPSMHWAGGVCTGEYLPSRGVWQEGGCGSHPPPPGNRMTDRCKNITLP